MLTRHKLSDVLGIAVTGIDLSQPLDDAAFREVEQAFFDGQVLVIKGQRLQPGQFVTFARRFGKPEPHVIDQFHFPGHADILILSNRRKDGKPVGLADAGSYFHTDYSYLDVPARVTMLYSIETPRRGGNTLFANMYAAYDDLTEAMKQRIENLVVRHHYGNRDDLNEASRTAASKLTGDQKDKVSWVRHRLVRTHYGTGRKALYAVSGSSFGIDGMPDDEAVQLLDELKDHAIQEKYRYSHSYEVGDVILWDDLSLLHAATLTDPSQPRTLWRITVKEPIGAWA